MRQSRGVCISIVCALGLCWHVNSKLHAHRTFSNGPSHAQSCTLRQMPVLHAGCRLSLRGGGGVLTELKLKLKQRAGFKSVPHMIGNTSLPFGSLSEHAPNVCMYDCMFLFVHACIHTAGWRRVGAAYDTGYYHWQSFAGRCQCVCICMYVMCVCMDVCTYGFMHACMYGSCMNV